MGMGMEFPGFIREVRLDRAKVTDPARHPYDIPAVAALDVLPLAPGLTVLVGENGAGKSTLIEAIAIAARFNAEGGSRNFRFAQRPSESELHRSLVLVRGPRRERTGFFLRAESLFNLATAAEGLGPDSGWEVLHEKSHGEAFLWLLQNRFGPGGLYILDEPESALSPQRQLAALQIIHTLIGQGSQFIMATHSPILMAYPGAVLYHLGPDGIARITYEDTEHYQITRTFLQNPERYFKHLLSDP